MFQGLSLDQAPPYKIPLQFYITATLYLIAFAVVFALYSTSIANRFDYDAIALTHFLTLGFFTHIMFGSMFQMIPVMLGLAYKNVVRNANIIYYTLNLGTLLFFSGFLTAKTALLHAGGTLLLASFLYFSLLSLKTVLESENKDFMVKTFATSFTLLALGSIFGFLALLVHAGVLFYPYFGDIHIALMVFGWVFLLINAVSYKIIPMFFVAKEFPGWIKNSFYLSVMFLLISFIVLREGEFLEVSQAVLVVVALLTIIFALFSIMILSKRKRKRKDLSITLWYFSMVNLILAALLFIYRSFFEYEYLDLVIGFFVLFGGIYALINAMLYKIVPFLTWFHLSSNMVFDAEMSQVILKKDMQLQVNLYYISYLFMLFVPLWSFMGSIAALVFSVASVLLFKNILTAYRYYNEYIKKAMTI